MRSLVMVIEVWMRYEECDRGREGERNVYAARM